MPFRWPTSKDCYPLSIEAPSSVPSLFSSSTICFIHSTMVRARRNTASASNMSIVTTMVRNTNVSTSVSMALAHIIITIYANTFISHVRSAEKPIASRTKESPRYMYLRDSKWSLSNISFMVCAPSVHITIPNHNTIFLDSFPHLIIYCPCGNGMRFSPLCEAATAMRWPKRLYTRAGASPMTLR